MRSPRTMRAMGIQRPVRQTMNHGGIRYEVTTGRVRTTIRVYSGDDNAVGTISSLSLPLPVVQWIALQAPAVSEAAGKRELVRILEELTASTDVEVAHARADDALIAYINDPDVTAAYDRIQGWYA